MSLPACRLDRPHLVSPLQAGGKHALPATIALSASLPEGGSGRGQKRKGLQEEIRSASLMSGVSTASMGKFDRLLKGEKPEERKLMQKRKKRLPVADKSGGERQGVTSIVGRIIRERSDDILDVDRAVSGYEREKREQRSKARLEQFKATGGVEKVKGKGKGPKKASGGKSSGHKRPGAKQGKKTAKGRGKK